MEKYNFYKQKQALDIQVLILGLEDLKTSMCCVFWCFLIMIHLLAPVA